MGLLVGAVEVVERLTPVLALWTRTEPMEMEAKMSRVLKYILGLFSVLRNWVVAWLMMRRGSGQDEVSNEPVERGGQWSVNEGHEQPAIQRLRQLVGMDGDGSL